MQLMLQATVCDCLALDPFAFEEDGLSAPEVDVSRGKIVEALVIAGMVVVRHEGGDLALEIAGQVVVLKQDAVLWSCRKREIRVFNRAASCDLPDAACSNSLR